MFMQDPDCGLAHIIPDAKFAMFAGPVSQNRAGCYGDLAGRLSRPRRLRRDNQHPPDPPMPVCSRGQSRSGP
jgi:hypothetical protein